MAGWDSQIGERGGKGNHEWQGEEGEVRVAECNSRVKSVSWRCVVKVKEWCWVEKVFKCLDTSTHLLQCRR